MRVVDLATQLEVSEMTIRRDLNSLEGQSLIQRTHGGAVLTERMMFEFDYRNRREVSRAAKHAIAVARVNALELPARGQATPDRLAGVRSERGPTIRTHRPCGMVVESAKETVGGGCAA